MYRIVKLAGSVGLIAMLAVVTCTAASAAEFHSEVAHTTFLGEQHAGEDTFTVNAGTARCSHLTYAGTQISATQTTISLIPAYFGCKALGFINTRIDTNGCSFVFHLGGSTSIACPAGQGITWTGFNCWITIQSQGPLSSVTYTNSGSGSARDVTIDLAVYGINYTQHSKSFPGCSGGTYSDGTYTGSATVRGSNTEGKQVGIWVD